MRPLLQLTALSDLCIGGEVVNDDVVIDVLSQLSSLRTLHVINARAITDRGLLALTALRQLTWLAVGGCGISFEVSRDFASQWHAPDDIHGESLELPEEVRCPDAPLSLLGLFSETLHLQWAGGVPCKC